MSVDPVSVDTAGERLNDKLENEIATILKCIDYKYCILGCLLYVILLHGYIHTFNLRDLHL